MLLLDHDITSSVSALLLLLSAEALRSHQPAAAFNMGKEMGRLCPLRPWAALEGQELHFTIATSHPS